ncbi:GNAT family N-acetyltransferase [Streptosporangium sp. CA-135522]|uniref:GNAT family N-acetyltransferase n=1 Tax=Streptosporangium sp. CA-135522 TaxID=3240072 RepID=UPI003D9436AA
MVERSPVEIRLLRTVPELQRADALLRTVWGSEHGDAPFSLDMMRALAHTGGYVAGAFTGDTMAGVTAGFRTVDGSLHSHVTGVLPGRQGRGIGLALKLHQRQWATELGLPSISWTYDPLIRRNAYFNLNRLGAMAEEYLPDFYGPINDEINGGDLTDRLFVSWEVPAPADREPPPDLESAEPLLDIGPREQPVPREASGSVLRCATPADIETLRRQDPKAARRWRLAMREALGGALARGYRIAGFHRSGWYLLCAKDGSV